MTNEELNVAQKKFGKKLKKIRASKGLSLLDVSYACSLDESHISKIEHGRFNISLATIIELAKGLDIKPSELLDF